MIYGVAGKPAEVVCRMDGGLGRTPRISPSGDASRRAEGLQAEVVLEKWRVSTWPAEQGC